MSKTLSIDFDQLFEKRGTMDMRFHPELEQLNGQRIQLSGRLLPEHHGREDGGVVLTDDSGLCPECSPVPVASVFVPQLAELDGALDCASCITVEGTLSVGFSIDAQRRATWLRLLGARIVTSA